MGLSLACQLVSEPTKQSFQRVFIRNNRLGDTHTRYNQATNKRGQSADNHARIITRWHNHQQAVAFTRYQSVPSVSLARVSVSLWRGRLPLMQHRAPPPNTYIITYNTAPLPHRERGYTYYIPPAPYTAERGNNYPPSNVVQRVNSERVIQPIRGKEKRA